MYVFSRFKTVSDKVGRSVAAFHPETLCFSSTSNPFQKLRKNLKRKKKAKRIDENNEQGVIPSRRKKSFMELALL